jgi:hypothetical protein
MLEQMISGEENKLQNIVSKISLNKAVLVLYHNLDSVVN